MIDCKVGLHGAQLMVLEGGAHAFGARRGAHVVAATEVDVFGVEICKRRDGEWNEGSVHLTFTAVLWHHKEHATWGSSSSKQPVVSSSF